MTTRRHRNGRRSTRKLRHIKKRGGGLNYDKIIGSNGKAINNPYYIEETGEQVEVEGGEERMLRIKGKEGLWAPHLLVKNMPAEGARKYNSPLGSMSMSARVNASGPGHWAVVDNAARLQQKMNETERYMRYGFPSSDTPPLNASAAAAARNYLAAGNAHYAAVKNYYK